MNICLRDEKIATLLGKSILEAPTEAIRNELLALLDYHYQIMAWIASDTEDELPPELELAEVE